MKPKSPTSAKLVTPRRENKKAVARQLQVEWEAMLARHSKPLDLGAKAKGVKAKPVKTVKHTEVIEQRPSSLMTPGGSTAKKNPMFYTGENMLGLATMHKSNTVPVFKAEEAVEIAQMRRN